MDEKTRAILKSFFETGDRPTQEQFSQLIDSLVNKKEDEIFIILPKKYVGIGVTQPKEKLDVAGGIRLSSTSNEVAGVIRWNGTDFEGFDGQEWKSLTSDSLASRELYIPQPRVECFADKVYAYWEDCIDNRFLDQSPVYWLYRYKSRIKQTYRDKTKRTRVIPKKWAHTRHLDVKSHKNSRHTEFPVNKTANKKQLLNLEPYKWFKSIPGDTTNTYQIPMGQGMHPVPKKPYFNRRFEYFRLRMVVVVDGKLLFGPFSEIFSLGFRRKYYSDPRQKKYKPVFELVQPGKGMDH